MAIVRFLFVAAWAPAWLLLACKVYDPLYCSEESPCRDPARSFCDLNGEYPASEGVARTCIPDPHSNSDPDAGEPDSGSEPDASVCGAGDPVTVSCDDGAYTETCHDGTLLEKRTCPLGCHAEGSRCNDLEPSNGLAGLLDLAGSADIVDLPDGTLIDTDSGEIRLPQGALEVTNELVSQTGAPNIRVYVVKSLILNDVIVSGDNALAFVADGTIIVQGRVRAAGRNVVPGPGAKVCNLDNGRGRAGFVSDTSETYPGGGGGGFATAGAPGGDASAGANTTPGAAGLSAGSGPGSIALTPLRGGCAGGGSATEKAGTINGGGGGGGAIQLSSRTAVALVANENGAGSIDVGGGGGPGGSFGVAGGGGAGGSGGAVLLEAPIVTVQGVDVLIAANGGGGGGGCAVAGQDGETTNLAASGANCSGTGESVGSGGDGGAIEFGGGEILPTAGESVTPIVDSMAGGGGGSYGRLRLNTATGEFTLGLGGAIYAATSIGTATVR